MGKRTSAGIKVLGDENRWDEKPLANEEDSMMAGKRHKGTKKPYIEKQVGREI